MAWTVRDTTALAVLVVLVLALLAGFVSVMGCTYFEKGAIQFDTGNTHLGKSFGVNIDTRTHVGLGFDEAHTDLDYHAAMNLARAAAEKTPNSTEASTNGGP